MNITVTTNIFSIFFFDDDFNKKIEVKLINNKTIPFNLISNASPLKIPATIICLNFHSKMKKIVINEQKINNDSVIPKIEFSIRLGSKAKKDAANNANFLSKNFFPIKYTTGIVIIPTPIETILVICIYSKLFLKSKKLKNIERNVCQPILLGNPIKLPLLIC